MKDITESQHALRKERDRWRTFPRKCPAQVGLPGPGQESVWEYPRPPGLQSVAATIRVTFSGILLAESQEVIRVLETSCPPTYYFPPRDVHMEYLERYGAGTLCEWKGIAQYWTVRIGRRISHGAAWSYPDPEPEFRKIRNFVAFYPERVESCRVGSAIVQPQEGDYYGGWITPDLIGPFKGRPGTEEW